MTHRPDLAASAIRRLTPAEAMGEYLQTWEWHHFVTLTVERQVSRRSLIGLFERDIVRTLARPAQQRIAYFFAIEHTSGPHVSPHLHGLVAGTRELTVDRIQAAWPHGLSRVRVYDPERGAAMYSAKRLQLDPDGYDFSTKPPRRREDATAARIRATLDTASLWWG